MNPHYTQALPVFIKSIAHEIRWQILLLLSHGDFRVQELVDRIGQPFSLVSYHLKILYKSELIRFRRSDADRRDYYYSLDYEQLNRKFLEARQAIYNPILLRNDAESRFSGNSRSERQEWPQLAPTTANHKVPETHDDDGDWQRIKILFLCTGNNARSQIAEALLRHIGGGRVIVFSAGIRPDTVHPLAIETLGRRGIDISEAASKHLSEYGDHTFDVIISVCDRVRAASPSLPGCRQTMHWSIADPTQISDDAAQRRAFEICVDELTTRIQNFVSRL